jgi:ketosteroid isomerase-like protein
MSQENVDAVKAAYAAFSAGDLEGAAAAFADDVEWTSPDSLPWGGTQRGPQEVIAGWVTIAESTDSFAVEPTKVFDAGDHVVVIAASSGSANGTQFDDEYAQVFEFSGDKVARVRIYIDPTAAVAAVGG